ncbi:hypothetical protein [Legionella sp.]|nr:hypothetical protein [Legionella sp.]
MREKFFSPKHPAKRYKIAIVTLPNAGHTRIVKQLVDEAKRYDPELDF